MSPQPYSLLDDTDPFGYAKRRRMTALKPTVPPAAINSSGASQGFDPDDPGDDPSWWKPQLDPAANRISSLPGLSSSSAAGTGQSAQPQADLNTGDVSAGAAKVLSGQPKMPPPGMPAVSDDPGAAGIAPAQAAKQLPPGMNPDIQGLVDQQKQLAANPPQMIGSRPQDIDPATGKEKLAPKLESWGQRLAMAALAATKLAPYAQQIVHPDYTQQVTQQAAAQKAVQDQLGTQEKLQTIGTQASTQAANEQYRQGLITDAQQKEADRAANVEAANQIKADGEFTKSLGKDDVVTGLDANDPNIPQLQAQGYHVIDDIRDHREGVPKMKVAIPPRFVTVSPDNQAILTGRPVGSLVPWSEYKSSLGEYEKAQAAVAAAKAKAANAPPTSESEKLAFQGIIQKVAAEHGMTPAALTDVRQLMPAIQNSKTLSPDEKNHAVAYLAANPTPAATGTNTIVKVDSGASQAGDRADTALKGAVYKTFAPAVDSAERFNIMAKNYEDAVKNNDQQAMLSLLSNHLGMTMGLQKGARLTKDIIQEAQHSRPWLQGMAAKFDGDGYLSGVTLTPQQMQQMVSLGRERFSEDLTKSRNEAQYLGATDDGPKRTPNHATINFYTAMAGGNAAKAKQLAQADGWSIQ